MTTPSVIFYAAPQATLEAFEKHWKSTVAVPDNIPEDWDQTKQTSFLAFLAGIKVGENKCSKT